MMRTAWLISAAGVAIHDGDHERAARWLACASSAGGVFTAPQGWVLFQRYTEQLHDVLPESRPRPPTGRRPIRTARRRTRRSRGLVRRSASVEPRPYCTGLTRHARRTSAQTLDCHPLAQRSSDQLPRMAAASLRPQCTNGVRDSTGRVVGTVIVTRPALSWVSICSGP